MILKRSPTGRTPTVTTNEKRRILKLSVQQSPKPQQSPRCFKMTIERASFCSSRTCKNSMRVYSGDFSRNDGLATERYLLNRPIAS